MNASSFFVLAVCACSSGCAIDTVSGPPRHETRSIERDTSDTARIDLEMGAGELRVNGGAQDLMQADFLYNVPAWRPAVRYHSFAGRADLTIRQAPADHLEGVFAAHTKCDWDLRLNNEIPIDFLLHFGAGDAHLNLGSLNLRSIEVEMGVGHIEMDLRGRPQRDYEARIHGGVGEAKVFLPPDAGIFATAHGGIGEIQVHGLRREGRHWVNHWHDSARPQVRVEVEGGIGQIDLIAE